jgi:hypothetical protein
MTKKLANAVETIIAPSDKIRKILEGYQVSCPVEVIPSGIHLEKYQLCKKEDWRKKSVCSLVYHRMHWCWYM